MLLHTDIKLLSLVLGEAIWGVVGVIDDQLDGTSVPTIILKVENGTRHLNLDTLGRLCKEWMNNKGYSMSMQTVSDGGMICQLYLKGKLVHFSGEDGDANNYIVLAEWVAKNG